MKKYLYPIIFLFATLHAGAQIPVWGFPLGGITGDQGKVVKVAPNGNVYVAGFFSGVMDLDPGPGIYNITSNGFADVYLACYASSGAFLWGFGIGGANYDEARGLAVDTASNVIVCGYIQSSGIDFDPGPGTAVMPYAGGSGITTCGDGFVAKYSSTGIYQWSYGLGGPTVYDHAECLATDPAGNVYVGGGFDDVMTIPGGPTFNSSVDGQAYIIKYSKTGTFIWAHNFGLPGVAATTTEPFGIQVSKGNIYIGGVFQATANFDPWGTPALLTTVGYYDAFIAKYDTNGNYIFAYPVSGSGHTDQILGLSLDAADNMYITGNTNSTTMTFDPASPATSTITAPGGGGNFDIFLAKYNSNGKYQWGTILGSGSDDVGWTTEVINNNVYFSGAFSNIVDFDPSAGVANLTSTGSTDLFIAKYDLSGNYICGFSEGVGIATADAGYGLAHDTMGNLYATGEFGGVTADFDPGTGSYILSSHGALDAYLVKYSFADGTFITGYAIGDTICDNTSAHITIVVTAGGPGPFDVTFTDGTTTYIQSGVYSGVPFLLSPAPTATTIYTITLVSSSSPGMCLTPTGSPFGTATVLVRPIAYTLTDTMLNCNTFQFTATGVLGSWAFGDGTTLFADPAIHSYDTAGTYVVIFKGFAPNECPVTDSLTITSGGIAAVKLGNDTALCAGSKLVIAPINTDAPQAAYLWNTGATTRSVTVDTSGKYWIEAMVGSCEEVDTINVLFNIPPAVQLGKDTSFCNGRSITLAPLSLPSPTSVYLWSDSSTNSTLVATHEGRYSLTVSDHGCKSADTIVLKALSAPHLNFVPDTTLCNGEILVLQAANALDAYVAWSTGIYSSSITVTESGTYYATAGNICGSDSDAVVVKFEPCDIWFPSAFTPNGDGNNDIARAVGALERVKDFTLSMYNRWGQRIFSTNDPYAGWDGKLNGVPQDANAYYYYINYSIEGKKGFLKGDITLIR